MLLEDERIFSENSWLPVDTHSHTFHICKGVNISYSSCIFCFSLSLRAL